MKKLFLLLILACVGTFFFFSHQKKIVLPPSQILSFCREGKEHALTSNYDKETLALFRGAAKLLEGDLSSAQFLLKHAEKNLSRSSPFLTDNLLLLALAAYADHQNEEFFSYFEKAKQREPLLVEESQLSSLVAFLKNDQRLAKCGFQKKREKTAETLFSIVEQELFTPLWSESHLALILLEEGEELMAKEMIEKDLDPLSLEKGNDTKLASLVLGLAHFCQSHHLTGKEQEIASKMALYFFENSGSLRDFPEERKRVAQLVVDQMKKEIEQQGLPNLSSFFPIVAYLEKWQERESLEELANHIASKHEIGPELLSYAPKGPFTHLLSEKAKKQILLKIKSQEVDGDSIIALIGEEPLKDIQDEIEKGIIQATHADFSRVESLFDLWQRIAEQRGFLHNFLEQGKWLWQQDGKESKGTRIFTLLLQASKENEREEFQSEIIHFFSLLFKEATRSYTVKRLLLIKEAIQQLAIPCKMTVSKEMIANTLEDAKYLFQIHNFSSCKLCAEFALSCDPVNEEALYLVGLASFHNGDYKRALFALKRLSNPNEDAKRALYLCQVEEEREPLAQMNCDFSEEIKD